MTKPKVKVTLNPRVRIGAHKIGAATIRHGKWTEVAPTMWEKHGEMARRGHKIALTEDEYEEMFGDAATVGAEQEPPDGGGDE